jgi:UDP-N-acetylglucosamine--N-acetylmuramyl-(pentapeptide) pyrophosphoryl-undecaprenol N-acetylglucosamine transferase
MRVVLAGGGTAGHIEPALALADALRQADPRAVLVCLGTERGLETRLVPMRGYELALIPAVPMPRSLTPGLLAVPGRLAGAVSAAAGVLDRVKADVLVGFGGYVATPAYLAARRRHVPIVVHEANPRPGLANKLGARFTEHVFTGNPSTELAHATFLGIPIRREIAELDRLALGDKARAHFGLRPDLPVLLVTGGSQGALSLNRAASGAIGWLRTAGVQVLHVTGPRNAAEVPANSGGAPYVAVPYVDRMDLAYAAADFALCRAGAMTCAELTAVGLPGAFVPLPHGNGEQRLNAQPIVAGGGGLLVEDADLTPEWIRDSLLPVLLDIDRVASMSEAAAALGRADADRELAQAVIGVIQEHAAGEDAGPAGPPAPAGNAGHWFDPASRGGPADHPGAGASPLPAVMPRPQAGPVDQARPPARTPMPQRQPRLGEPPLAQRPPGPGPAAGARRPPAPGGQPADQLGGQLGVQLGGEPPMPHRQPPLGQPPFGQPPFGQPPLGRPAMSAEPPGPRPNADLWFGSGPRRENSAGQQAGPPWAAAEPQPDPPSSRPAASSRRGQPRHGRPRRGA